MGLLNFDLNDPNTAAQLALAAGLMGTPGSFARGIGAAIPGMLGAFGASQQAALERQLQGAKIADLRSQSKVREADAARKNQLLDYLNQAFNTGGVPTGPGGSAGTPAPYAAPSALAQGAAVGDVGPTVTNAARMPAAGPGMPAGPATMPAPQGAGMYGVPREAIMSDLAFNEGKGIPGMIEKRSAPNWQNINGYMVNTNDPAFRGGFQPGLTVSQDGKATMTTIGPDGRPRIQAPQGAVETYGGYLDAQAAREPMQVFQTGPDGKGGGMVWTNKADLLRQASPPSMQGPFNAQGQATMQTVRQDLADPSTTYSSPAVRQALQRAAQNAPEMPQRQMSPQAGPTDSQAAAAAAEKEFKSRQAKDAADYMTSLSERVHQSGELNIRLQESIAALDKFRAGGGAEVRAQLAQMAQAVGLPDGVVKGVAGGELWAMQEFNKLAVQQAMETLKSSMDGQGRIAQAEFKVFQANNPNLNTDPMAIRKIAEFQTGLFRRDLEEQRYARERLQAGTDPSQIKSDWAQQQVERGITNPQLRAVLKPGEQAPAGPSDKAAAQLFKMLPNAAEFAGKTMRNTEDGSLYKSDGSRWTKVK